MHCPFIFSYVDNQLRHSRRFNAQGIEQDHPELFVPFPRRRTSSSTSLSSMTSLSEEFYLKEEGQLRYWTMDMCSHSPHLFDFVVTVSRLLTSCALFPTFFQLARWRWYSVVHILAVSACRTPCSPFCSGLPWFPDKF